jgi:putative ABC transport system substrate-binding protein
MNRREIITLLGGAGISWPLAARAQQMPVIGMLVTAPAIIEEKRMAAYRRGLGESGYVEGQNVVIDYFQADNQYERLPILAADLVRRRVSVIVTPNSESAALAATAATGTIPIVFSVTDDPVRVGLVASLARPGSNATGVNFFSTELGPKRLGLLREILPAVATVAVLVNPTNPTSEIGLQQVQAAARASGLKLRILSADDSRQIDAAFEDIARERPDGFMLINDPLFTSRRIQIIILAARHSLPAIYSTRDYPEAGGLMSYAASMAEVYGQLGVYTGRILKGAKPAELPVVQSTKFELVINTQTAKSLGISIPETMLAQADEVIE